MSAGVCVGVYLRHASCGLYSPSLSPRRKAEEDRVRKEEEKARREIIKQEYLQRKQEALMEEQGLVKPRPRTKSRRSRPKSLHREESNSLSKGSSTCKNTLKQHICLSSAPFYHAMYLLSAKCVCLHAAFQQSSSECVHVCYAGNSLKVSMLNKAKGSAAGCRGGEPSNLLCMM